MNLRRALLVVLFMMVSGGFAVAQPLDLTPPYTPSGGCDVARSQIISYRKLSDALCGDISKSVNFTLLSGEWRVQYYDAVPEVDAKVSMQTWGSAVNVPSEWQMEGKGVATYSHSAYAFLESAPIPKQYPMPKAGTVALYQRDFTVPFDLMDKKLYLNVGGGSSKVTLFINGKKVGFSTDSRTRAEYEIAEYVVRGLNRISLMVEQFSGGGWVEDNEGWKLSGLNRDIYLYAQPKIRVRDVMVTTSLDPTYKNGLLSSALLLKSELLNEHSVTVYYSLYDPSGEVIRKGDKEITLDMRREDTVRFNTTLLNVERWSAETPELYTIVFSIMREGRFTEYASFKVGFRSVETSDGVLIINGERAVIKGVNYDEFDAAKGNIVNSEQVLADMKQLKLVGINALRVGGYTMPAYFYDMADSLGFYVVTGANLSTRGLSNDLRKGYSLANDPRWCSIFVERVVAAYEMTKRYTSVVALSLGEDAGNGYNMYEAYLEVKRRDPERLVMYNGAGSEWNTDIVCPQYPTVAELKRMKTLQPVLPSRVPFDKKYWELENTSGGFIDRWRGLNLENTTASYAKKDNDYKVTKQKNGTVKMPSAQSDIKEIMALFAGVTMKVVNRKDGVVELTNRLQSTNLNYYTIRYRTTNGFVGKLLNKNAKWSEYTEVKVDCEAGQSVQLTLKKIPNNSKCEIEIGNIFREVF